MSRSNRYVLAALAGLGALFSAAGFGAYYGSLYSPDHKQYAGVAGEHRGQNDYQGPSESLRDISGVPGPFERFVANPPPTSGQDHEKRDLAAQEAMAVWAFWMFTAAVATFGVTSFGTILIWKQVKLTREAVEDTGKATVAMQEANRIALLGVKAQHKPAIVVSALGPYTQGQDDNFPSVSKFSADGPFATAILGAFHIRNIGSHPVTIRHVLTGLISDDRGGGQGDVFFTLLPGSEAILNPKEPRLTPIREREWLIGSIHFDTKENILDFFHNPPAIWGRILYEDTIGVHRVQGFAFQPGQRWDCDEFERWGGSAYNYEREIPHDRNP